MVAIEWITRILLNFVNSLDMRCTCGYYQQRCSNDGVWYLGHWLFVSGAVDVSILPALWCMSNFNFSNTSAQLKFYRMSFEGRFTSLIGVARGGTNTRVDRLLPSPILIYSNNSKPSFACHIISRDPTSPTFCNTFISWLRVCEPGTLEDTVPVHRCITAVSMTWLRKHNVSGSVLHMTN